MKSVDFITNIAPHYRCSLWLELLRIQCYSIKFFFGVEPKSSIRQIDFSKSPWRRHTDRLVRLSNVRFRHALVWQRGVLRNAATSKSEVSVFLGDMYVLSTWIAVLVLRLRGRKVVFWGHGLYGSEGAVKKYIRTLFLRRADMNLVYGERSRKLLVESKFAPEKVRVIFNSLDYEAQKSLRKWAVNENFFCETRWFRECELPTLVYIGRLTRGKRLDKLISAVNELNASESRFNLLLIGDGPERRNLETLVSNDVRTVYFYGPCYEEERLARLIANAELCISPGEIGLPAIHAMSYGTPACSHSDFSRQGPEVEAIVEGVTGTFFDGSIGDLQKRIVAWFGKTRNREEVRAACYQVVDQKYNPEVQCRILEEALDCL